MRWLSAARFCSTWLWPGLLCISHWYSRLFCLLDAPNNLACLYLVVPASMSPVGRRWHLQKVHGFSWSVWRMSCNFSWRILDCGKSLVHFGLLLPFDHITRIEKSLASILETDFTTMAASAHVTFYLRNFSWLLLRNAKYATMSLSNFHGVANSAWSFNCSMLSNLRHVLSQRNVMILIGKCSAYLMKSLK